VICTRWSSSRRSLTGQYQNMMTKLSPTRFQVHPIPHQFHNQWFIYYNTLFEVIRLALDITCSYLTIYRMATRRLLHFHRLDSHANTTKCKFYPFWFSAKPQHCNEYPATSRCAVHTARCRSGETQNGIT